MGSKLFKKKEFKILLLGISKSGKISILENLNQDKNIDPLNYFIIWTYKTPERLRGVMKTIYSNVDGTIFVVDSSDLDKIEDGAEELAKLSAEFNNLVILVMANKQDLKEALPSDKVSEKLGMN